MEDFSLSDAPPPMPVDQVSSPAVSWTTEEDKSENDQPSNDGREYIPIFETLRLYAGWLLAWYCLVYAIGSYQYMKEMPFRIPYAESLFLSPLVLSFTLAAFLFLLCSSLHRALGGGKILAFVMLLLGCGLFWVYRINLI